MRLSLPNVLRSKRRSVLGMDIGSDGVRLALVHGSRDGIDVEWTEEVSLTELQGFADYDSVLAKLQGVLAERLPHRLDVATAPPWNSARVVIEEMPAMDAGRFAKAASWYFARNRHEDMLHPVDLGIAQAPRTTVEGKSVLDGMMFSMDRVMMTGLADMCTALRLQLTSLLPAPACHASLLGLRGSGHRHTLVIDIGAGQTRMTLSSEGNVRLVRKLRPCANDLVRDLCESLGVGWETANQTLLAASGLGPLAHDDPEGVVERARPVIDRGLDRLATQLIGEIERSAAYVHARHGEAVDSVLIAGGLGGAPALIERLTRDSSLNVAPFDPFGLSGRDVDLPAAARPRFALAVGAAAMALRGDPAANLLAAERAPEPERRRVERRTARPARRVLVTATTVGLLAGVGAFEWNARSTVTDFRQRIGALHAEREQLRLVAHELTRNADLFDLQDRIETLRGIYRSRRLFTPFFTRVVQSLPEGMRLDDVTVTGATAEGDGEGPDAVQGGLRVVIAGHTSDVDAVGAFVVMLEREQLLQEIEVLRILERSEGADRRGFGFELRGRPAVLQQLEVLAAAERERDATAEEVAR